MSNGLDPDRDGHSVSTDMGPKRLQAFKVISRQQNLATRVIQLRMRLSL